MSLETKIAGLMIKNISHDVSNIAHFVGGSVTRIAAMTVVGNLPDKCKREIYQGEDEVLLSKLSTGVSIISNIGIGIGSTYFVDGEYKAPLDFPQLLVVYYMAYSVVEGVARALMLITPKEDKTLNTNAPGNIFGGIIYWPLYGLNEYLKAQYQESKKEVMEKYS